MAYPWDRSDVAEKANGKLWNIERTGAIILLFPRFLGTMELYIPPEPLYTYITPIYSVNYYFIRSTPYVVYSSHFKLYLHI